MIKDVVVLKLYSTGSPVFDRVKYHLLITNDHVQRIYRLGLTWP